MFLLKILFYLLTLLLNIELVKTQINFCDDENIIGSTFWLCKSNDYIKKAEKPWPIIIKERIIVNDIPEFNEDEKTVTLFITFVALWNDTRIKIKSIDPSVS